MSSSTVPASARHRILKTYDWSLKASVNCSESLKNLQPIVRVLLHFEDGDTEVAEFTKDQFEVFLGQLGVDPVKSL